MAKNYYSMGIDTMLSNRYEEALEYSDIVKESEDYGTISLTIKVPTHGGNRSYERIISTETMTYALASVIEKILDKEMDKSIDTKKSQSFVVVVDTKDIIKDGYRSMKVYIPKKVEKEHDGSIFFSCALDFNMEGDPIITLVTVLPKKRMETILCDKNDVYITSNSVNLDLLKAEKVKNYNKKRIA